MTTSLTPNEGKMQLPDIPKGRCLNHPTVKAVRLHLCAPCLEEWKKKKLDYDTYYFSASGVSNTRSPVGVKEGEWVPRPSEDADTIAHERKEHD